MSFVYCRSFSYDKLYDLCKSRRHLFLWMKIISNKGLLIYINVSYWCFRVKLLTKSNVVDSGLFPILVAILLVGYYYHSNKHDKLALFQHRRSIAFVQHETIGMGGGLQVIYIISMDQFWQIWCLWGDTWYRN